MHFRILTAAILLALAGNVAAQIYSWKDASGRVHYSDQPPADVDSKTVKQGTRPPAPQPSANQSAPAAGSTAASAPKSW
jgi:hypothetical protein